MLKTGGLQYFSTPLVSGDVLREIARFLGSSRYAGASTACRARSSARGCLAGASRGGGDAFAAQLACPFRQWHSVGLYSKHCKVS